MTRVKICGITSTADALAAIEFGADEIGLNFFHLSPRFVNFAAAAEIANAVAGRAALVGVFVNEPNEKIQRAAAELGLDALQLHGSETPGQVRQLSTMTTARLIRAFRTGPGLQVRDEDLDHVHAVLVDAFDPNEFGGTGRVADWQAAVELRSRCRELYLAGGLDPANVVDAVVSVRPDCVDVCSGVESAPGSKDRKKLEDFIRTAKRA